MKRKTVEVKWLRELINKKLLSDCLTDQEKQSLALTLEEILHKTGNYNGFSWNYWMEKGFEEWKAAGVPDFPEKDRYIYGNRSIWDRTYF
jgi:hypothetical protein